MMAVQNKITKSNKTSTSKWIYVWGFHPVKQDKGCKTMFKVYFWM